MHADTTQGGNIDHNRNDTATHNEPAVSWFNNLTGGNKGLLIILRYQFLITFKSNAATYLLSPTLTQLRLQTKYNRGKQIINKV